MDRSPILRVTCKAIHNDSVQRRTTERSTTLSLFACCYRPDDTDFRPPILYRWMRGPMTAIARFCMGLVHDDDHLEQIAEIVRQGHALRQPVA